MIISNTTDGADRSFPSMFTINVGRERWGNYPIYFLTLRSAQMAEVGGTTITNSILVQ